MKRPGRNRRSKPALRTHRVPHDYIEWMCCVFPALRDIDPKHCQRLLWLTLDATAELRRHRADPALFCIFSDERRRLFGKKFDDLNHRTGIFSYQRSFNSAGGMATGFSLSMLAQFAYDEYMCCEPDLTPVDCIAGDATVNRSLARAVASRDLDDDQVKVWRGTQLKNSVHIDVEEVQRLFNEYRSAIPLLTSARDTNHAKKRMHQCVLTLRLAHTTDTKAGFLPHHYREASTGRLVALGLNAQSMTREVRAAAFRGLYDYDIENCHFAIAEQICARPEIDVPCPIICDYNGDRTGTRLALGKRLLIPEGEVKKCLLAKLYGATDSSFYKNAIPDLIGVAKSKQLHQDEWFGAFSKEIERVMSVVVERWPRRNGDYIVNEGGKGIKRTEKLASIFAHILQGAEGVMLSAVCRAFPDDVLVPIHDGFISRRSLHLQEIASVIAEVTGYRVKISERVLVPIEVRAHYKLSLAPIESGCMEMQHSTSTGQLCWAIKDHDRVELSGPVACALPLGSGVTLRKLMEAAALGRQAAGAHGLVGSEAG